MIHLIQHKLPVHTPDELTEGTFLRGIFQDRTPFSFDLTNGQASLQIEGCPYTSVPQNNIQGLWSTVNEKGDTYEIYLELTGRDPWTAFLPTGDRLALVHPENLSPSDWTKIAGSFHKLGYDIRDWQDAKDRFTYLTERGRSAGNPGYMLQPDQQQAVEQIYHKRPKPKTDAKLAADLEQKALSHFGQTYIHAHAGYLTPNGYLLNFSHEGYQRDMDHRVISEIFETMPDFQDLSGNEAMYLFMNMGNIRVHTCGINLIMPPTNAQRKILLLKFKRLDDEAYVDFSSPTGTIASSARFPLGTPAHQILQTIDRYFETGYTGQEE